MSKKLFLLQFMLKPWQTLTIPPFSQKVGGILILGVLIVGLAQAEPIHNTFFSIQPAYAQRVSFRDAWQQVYKQLPDLPKENKYISKETGKVADNNTLVGRIISYHLYVKGRALNYRLDWKLTLADYLNANEVIYDTSYPGNDTLRENPLEGDRAAIRRLTRRQRNALVQALVNVYSQN